MSPLTSIPEWLFTLAGVSTGAVGLVWLVTLLLRRKSAALRHLFWLLALSAPLLALPLGLMHARIAIPILPHTQELASTHDLASQSEIAPPSSAFNNGDQISTAATPALSTTPVARHEFMLPFSPWIIVWFFGAVSIILRILFSQMRVRRLIQNGCSPGPEALLLRSNRTKQHFKLTRSVRLMVTPLTEIPFCHGVFQPTVIFPESWHEWDDERIEVCLTHELAHIIRGDLLAMLAGQIACILCWFNPLVWFAESKLRDEAENSADDLVLARNIRPETYASNLVAITEKYRASALSPTIALSMARPNRLKARIEAILDSTLRRKSPGFAMKFTVSLLATGALVTVMVVRLTAAPVPILTGQKLNLVTLDPQLRDGIWEMANNAIKSGDIQAVDSLLKRGLNVNVDLESDKVSLLFLAVDDNQLAIVKLLLAKGADVNQKTSWGDTPIQRACWRGYSDIADVLIRAGAKPDDLHYTTGMGNVAALEALDKKKPLSVKQARDAINFAVVSGHQNTFDWLWSKLGPMDDQQKDKLLGDLYERAGTWGQVGILKHLEELGASRAKFGSRALVNAVCWNFPDTVTYLLDKGVSPNSTPPHWGSMLRDSAGEGHIEIVRLLLDHGADINVRDGQGLTPLSWAAYNGKDDVCQLLLERGADGNIEDNMGENAAWNAAGGAHCPEALALMIKKGVKLTGVNKQGQTIMSYIMQFRAPSPGRIGFPGKIYSASEMQDYNRREQRVVDLLTAAGLDFKGNEGTETPLMSALEGQHFGDARALIDHGADLSIKDKDGNTALEYIFNWGQGALPLDILETILKRGGDPNTDFHIQGMQPPMAVPLLEEVIGIAANEYVDASSFRDAVKMLLDHGAKFPGTTDDKVQVLLQAAARGNLTAIQGAIRLGTSINAADGNGWNALTISTALGYDEAASWLIANGADIEGHTRPPGNFSTPLGFAVERGQADLVEKLLAKGAKPNDGIVGIVFAIRQNNQRIFDDLIKAGADPRNEATCTVTTGGVSYTPPDSKSIFLCIRNGNPAMAKTLLDKGENPNPANLQDNRGFVYWAIYYNQPEILKALLDHGANPSLKDAHGETPLALAQKSHPKMVSVLEEATNRTQAPK